MEDMTAEKFESFVAIFLSGYLTFLFWTSDHSQKIHHRHHHQLMMLLRILIAGAVLEACLLNLKGMLLCGKKQLYKAIRLGLGETVIKADDFSTGLVILCLRLGIVSSCLVVMMVFNVFLILTSST
jgi:hypothetical protein